MRAPSSSLISVPTPAPVMGATLGDDAEHLGEGERDQREIGAAQPGAEGESADGARRQRRPGRDADRESRARR